jgi:nitroreductase
MEVEMNYEELLELLKKRRSIRRFTSDPVSDEHVDMIIDAGRLAPSGFNQQPWDFVIVKDPVLKDGIVQICEAQVKLNAEMEATREPWQTTPKAPPPPGPGGDYRVAPVFILVLGDTRTRKGLPMIRRYDDRQWQLVFVSGVANTLLAMHLAATTLGLGGQWVSRVSTAYGNCMIKNLLGIPEPFEIYDMMVLGHSASTPPPRLMREKEKMVHYDHCGPESFRTDDEVNDFIKRSRA